MSKLNKIEYFRDRLDPEVILEALGIEVVDHSGANLIAHCPNPDMHENGDANPSWGFHTDKLLYNCFACGGGTVVDLVQNVKKFDEDTAVEWLRLHADFEPTTAKDFQQEIEKILAPDEARQESLPRYSPESVFQYKFVHPYLLHRGISAEVCDKMGVGFDPEHMAIVVPHFFRGQLVGIQRRHLIQREDKFICPRCSEKHTPKYKNTAHFPKKFTLYNYDNLAYWKTVNVVESPMTALYLMSHGYENVTATFGNFGPEQMALLIGAKEVNLWPDNDSSGLKNLQDSLLILEKNVSAYIIPAVPGDKSDGANVPSTDLWKYMDARYPSTLFKLDGLKIGV